MKKIHKERGDMAIGNMIVIITTLLVSTLLILGYATWHSQLAVMDSVHLAAGSYIQAMSSSGCLNDVQKTQLMEEMASYGVSEINLTGTTLTPAGYGEKIVLHITGILTFPGTGLVMDDEGFQFGEISKEIDIIRSTTAYR